MPNTINLAPQNSTTSKQIYYIPIFWVNQSKITFSPFSFGSFDKWLDFDVVQSHIANNFVIHIVKSESALIRSFDTNPGFSKRCEIIVPTLFIKLVSMEVNHIVVFDCICFPTHHMISTFISQEFFATSVTKSLQALVLKKIKKQY